MPRGGLVVQLMARRLTRGRGGIVQRVDRGHWLQLILLLTQIDSICICIFLVPNDLARANHLRPPLVRHTLLPEIPVFASSLIVKIPSFYHQRAAPSLGAVAQGGRGSWLRERTVLVLARRGEPRRCARQEGGREFNNFGEDEERERGRT